MVKIYGLFALAILPALSVFAQSTAPSAAHLSVGTSPVGSVHGEQLPSNTARPGLVDAVVRLSEPPLAAVAGSRRSGWRMSPEQQRAYVQQLEQKQNALMSQAAAQGARYLGRLTRASNGLIVSVDRSRIPTLSALPGVASVRELRNYEVALSSVREYIGANVLQAAGVTGAGVRIAVLDSGIDYTHRNLGGPGTVAAYQAAAGTPSASDPRHKLRDGLFPTEKVYEGYDFVGESWPTGSLAPDPDPIDRQSHGTHVADIAAGRSADGTHKGIAPDAKLLAVKVCSAISTSCSPVAILQGIEYAADPNGDFNMADAVDVINLSLGQDFGMREDDATEALRVLSRAGIVVVTSAGNGGNIPYIMGSPGSGPTLISVAQTEVPGASNTGLQINAPPAIAGMYRNTATVDWAPVGSGLTNTEVVYVGRACPAGSISAGSTADPLLANPAGKVALVDRGACSISLKVDYAADAGAVGVLIGLVAPGDAISFISGGGDTFVPTLVITQSTANLIKDNISAPVRVTYGPSTALPLAGNVVSSSSRGPGYSYNAIKPDIAAPGASVSAEVGTGTGETAFGGTSGASPVVAGAAALLVQACPSCTPVDIKARLMNSADNNVFTNNLLNPGVLAPVTRIGAGEVRVAAAAALTTAAWDASDPESVSLSLGSYRTNTNRTFQRKVVLRNSTATQRTYAITPSFRYANDAASGAVMISAPPSIVVPANRATTFVVTFTVIANALPQWNTNAGQFGGMGSLLEGLEFDGYLEIKDAAETVRLPWHVLPHKAAGVTASTNSLSLGGGTGSFSLANIGGAAAGGFDVFALTGTSPRLPSSALPRRGENFAVIDLKETGARLVGLGQGQLGIQFAITTWDERAHPTYPARFFVAVDTNGDSIANYLIFNQDSGTATGSAPSGQNLVFVQPLNASGNAAGSATAYFYSDVDFNSSNIVLTAPLSALGATAATRFNYSVLVFDGYYTGILTDSINGIQYTPAVPRFSATPMGGTLPPGAAVNVNVQSVPGGELTSPSQTGLLMLYRDALSGKESSTVTITP